MLLLLHLRINYVNLNCETKVSRTGFHLPTRAFGVFTLPLILVLPVVVSDKEEVLRKKQKPLPHYEPWRGGGGRGGGVGGFGGGGGTGGGGKAFNLNLF